MSTSLPFVVNCLNSLENGDDNTAEIAANIEISTVCSDLSNNDTILFG